MINHMKIVSIAPAAILALASAHAETRTYNLDGFSRISASAGVDVEASVGGSFSVRAEGDAENIERLRVTKRGDRLIVGRERDRLISRWKGGRAPVVYVTLPSLEEAEASSGADLRASGIDSDRFSASASSGAVLELDGNCGSLDISASTGAELDADGLVCRDVEIDISTGAEASVHASESIDASASTGGGVQVYGSPQTRNISRSLGGDVDIN